MSLPEYGKKIYRHGIELKLLLLTSFFLARQWKVCNVKKSYKRKGIDNLEVALHTAIRVCVVDLINYHGALGLPNQQLCGLA